LLFAVDDVPLASIPVEAYRIASNPILPTIPLFTLIAVLVITFVPAISVGVVHWFGP